jgi:hypothetical protein
MHDEQRFIVIFPNTGSGVTLPVLSVDSTARLAQLPATLQVISGWYFADVSFCVG